MDSDRLAAILYDVHDFFNAKFFDRALPHPIFTFSAEGRNRLGYFWPGKWMAIDEEEGPNGERAVHKQTSLAVKKDRVQTKSGVLSDDLPDEINMHSELGLARPLEAVMATVYHEMCHQAQYRDPVVYGKPGKNNYHNKAWHVCCQRAGLETEGNKGYTKVTPAFREVIAEFPRPSDWIARIPGVRVKQPTRMKLWECSCAPKPVKIRAAVELDITCNTCGEDFVLQEDADDSDSRSAALTRRKRA